MAAPTSIATNEALVTAAGSSSAIDTTNAANRQVVMIQNNGPQPITLKVATSYSAITVGIGFVLQPGDLEWFWLGQNLRIYGKVGPVPAGETAVDQVTGAATMVTELV